MPDSTRSDKDRGQDTLDALLAGDSRAEREIRSWIRITLATSSFNIPRSERDDVIQETLLSLIRTTGKPGFSLKRSLRGLVQTIALARCVDWLRRKRPMQQLSIEHDGYAPHQLDNAILQDELKHLALAIAELDLPCQNLIRDRFERERPFSAIAEELGDVSDNALRGRLHYCLRKLRQRLKVLEKAGGEI